MPDRSPHNEPPWRLPSHFFEWLIKDIPAETWIRFIGSHPSLKEAVFEGFGVPARKIGRILRQPQIVARLQRIIRSDPAIFDEILQIWGQEHLDTMAFMEILDQNFLLENGRSLKNFIGPEQFFAGLYLLGYLKEMDFQGLINEGFWEHQIETEILEPLAPFWHLWNRFAQQYPQAKNWLEKGPALAKEKLEAPQEEPRHVIREQLHRLEERCSKLQTKLNKAEDEKSQLQQENMRHRKEIEALKTRLTEIEKTSERQREEALTRIRALWFERYQSIDRGSIPEAERTLDSLLRRTERAFDLQRQADEEYGSIAAVRQKMIHLELYLKEIERIYADSLVVHSEVARSKEALLLAKENLAKLPGIRKILKQEPALLTESDLRQRIRLLDATPENLPKISRLYSLLNHLVDLGFSDRTQSIFDDIEHKKRQIMESMHAKYETAQGPISQHHCFENLDDFVDSRASRKYDVYVDGYNILLQLEAKNRTAPSLSLTALREQFIDAVIRKSHHFHRVYLVFDGQKDSRERQGNTEIIFTDKNRGDTADAHIILAVQKRKDRQVLLATDDQEIIKAVEDRLYAVISSYHFYLFIYDMSFPPVLRS
jgi:predicted RNA-binding protein with PIN domain